MPNEIDELSRAIANGKIIDDYSLWRINKDIEDKIYSISRANDPLPIEIVRLRAILRRARALRKKRPAGIDQDRSVGEKSANHQIYARSNIADGFDPYEFVAHYRSLGGLRVATGWGDKIRIHLWNEETPEAAEFWRQRFNTLSLRHQNMVAASLLERGLY